MSQRDSGTTGVAGLRWGRGGGMRGGKVKGVNSVRDDEPIYHDELEQFKPYFMEEWRMGNDENYDELAAVVNDYEAQLTGLRAELAKCRENKETLRKENARLTEIEKCALRFADVTHDASFKEMPTEEALKIFFYHRVNMLGKFAQLRDGVPEWWTDVSVNS